MNKVVVTNEFEQTRLDAFLVTLLDGKSRSYAQKVIEESKIDEE